MRVHIWRRNGITNPNQGVDSSARSEDMLCGRGLDHVPAQDTDSIVKDRCPGIACLCCHCHRLSVRRTGRVAEVEFKGRKQLDKRATCGLRGCADGANIGKFGKKLPAIIIPTIRRGSGTIAFGSGDREV